ncbi:hypothetical protein DRO64_02910 [Candidatus Bathyarchaeota archaeon]|nr:MAG: hypothetical protein DRO64_02910 [Candidatus Bathyarchaeota archaeon]
MLAALIGLSIFISIVGTHDIRAPILTSLFSTATILYALSLAAHIYAAYTRHRAQYLPPIA